MKTEGDWGGGTEQLALALGQGTHTSRCAGAVTEALVLYEKEAIK